MKYYIALLCAQVALVAALEGDYLNPTKEEKASCAALRGFVAARISESYMKEDDFLLRFLREKNMDVPETVKWFNKMLTWRSTNKIDTIMDETNADFERFDGEFPGEMQGCDLAGRPVISAKASEGNVTSEVKQGKGDLLKRYTLQTFERATAMLRTMNKNGEKVSQVTLIADLGGFKVEDHAHPDCLPIYFNLLDQFQSNYPGYLHKIVAINTPSYAMPVWNAYKSKASPKLQQTVEIFSTKEQFDAWAKNEIAPEERTADYGGTKAKGLPLRDLYKSGKTFKCKAPLSEYGL